MLLGEVVLVAQGCKLSRRTPSLLDMKEELQVTTAGSKRLIEVRNALPEKVVVLIPVLARDFIS